MDPPWNNFLVGRGGESKGQYSRKKGNRRGSARGNLERSGEASGRNWAMVLRACQNGKADRRNQWAPFSFSHSDFGNLILRAPPFWG